MALPDLKTIKDRCQEVGECWIWMQYCTPGGYPTSYHNGKKANVRRRVYELSHPRMTDGTSRAISSTCGERLCCNPAHLTERSRSLIVKDSYRSRNVATEYPARLAAVMSRAHIKITPELAKAIRLDPDKSHAQWAREIGCKPKTVARVRSGESWRFAAPNSSVFNMVA